MRLTKEKLIEKLIKDGYLKTPTIIDAFNKIDRADFVPENLREVAYANQALPIGEGQTISQPLTVAFMLELLQPKKGDKILDVGSGSGWQAALLSEIVGDEGKIISIERISNLKLMAESNIEKYKFLTKGITKVILGDGGGGHKEEAPYDKIIAAASAEDEIPYAWKEQLKIGGKIVAPLGQSIVVIEKIGQSEFSEKSFFGFTFVPLLVG